eukprot:10791550-Lingulodinium_polyedra.AAC.1
MVNGAQTIGNIAAAPRAVILPFDNTLKRSPFAGRLITCPRAYVVGRRIVGRTRPSSTPRS